MVLHAQDYPWLSDGANGEGMADMSVSPRRLYRRLMLKISSAPINSLTAFHFETYPGSKMQCHFPMAYSDAAYRLSNGLLCNWLN